MYTVRQSDTVENKTTFIISKDGVVRKPYIIFEENPNCDDDRVFVSDDVYASFKMNTIYADVMDTSAKIRTNTFIVVKKSNKKSVLFDYGRIQTKYHGILNRYKTYHYHIDDDEYDVYPMTINKKNIIVVHCNGMQVAEIHIIMNRSKRFAYRIYSGSDEAMIPICLYHWMDCIEWLYQDVNLETRLRLKPIPNFNSKNRKLLSKYNEEFMKVQ